VEFRILGPIEVEADGRLLPTGRGRRRSLLGLLLLNRNASVDSDWIVDMLWGERPPPRVRTALQNQVWQLRKVLGSDRLETRGSGYALRVGADELDLDRFERLRTEGRLEEALALWRGRPLAELAYEPWAQTEIARLEDLRLGALEDRIEIDLARGRHAEVAAELRALVAAHPLREGLLGQLMLALYRGGRQAEALEVFRAARTTLVDELGIEPGPELRNLEREILRHSDALAAVPTEAPTTEPREAGLVGRSRELAELRGVLARADVPLLTLTGPGGAGKTTLAIEAAAASGWTSVFVDLSAVREAAHVQTAVADAFGLHGADAVPAALRGRRVLVVLDNFEQVREAAPFVEQLAAEPGPVILVTSRIPLRARGERLYVVRPLDEQDAVVLFVERASAARTDFELTDANLADVSELCRRLDGLPLALELAAARIALLSPRAILARLGRRLDLLKASAPDVPERHRTLRAAVEWSHELLRPDERALFAGLAVFAGGFTADGADAVTEPLGVDVLDGLEELLAASLIRPERTVFDEPRFGMLETIREYALERLAQLADVDEIRERHARFHLALAERAEPELRGPRQVGWSERLDAEQGNVRTALAWADEDGDADVGLRLAAGLWRFWQIRGHAGEGREILDRLLARAGPRTASRVDAVAAAARLAIGQGDFEAMTRHVHECLPVYRDRGAEASVAFMLAILGCAAHAQGDTARALALTEEAVEAARRSSDPWIQGLALTNHGMVIAHAGELERARRVTEEGLRAARDAGDARYIGAALARLGAIAFAVGDVERAEARLQAALALQRELGDTFMTPTTLAVLAQLAQAAGDRALARRRLEEILAIAEEAGDRTRMAQGLELLGHLAVSEGRSERAARIYGAVSVVREGFPPHPYELARPDHQHAIDEARAALGEEAFAAAWADGRAMTLADALAYARDP
jgi:predicted ATPase/DNA-binding SARP family transcriptional activator